jgi:hypothetical protein
LSLLSLPRAGSRSRRLVVCGAAAAIVLLPATAQAETTAPAPAAESSTAAVATSSPDADATATPSEVTPSEVTPTEVTPTEATPTEATPTEATPTEATPTGGTTSAAPAPAAAGDTTAPPTTDEPTPSGTATPTETDPSELPTFPEIDPAVLTGLFVPSCDNGTLTTLTLQLDKLRGLLQELQDGGFPVPEEAFAELPNGTIDIPVDDATLGELATELNAASAEFAELGLDDADLQAALAELPAGIRGDVEQLLGELQTGTVQTGTLRTLLMEVFPCPVEAPVAPVAGEDVDYLGYAPTGGTGSDGGSPLALLGGGAALLAGGGLFAASSLRSRAARA